MNNINFGEYIFLAPEVLPTSALPIWMADHSGLYAILAYDVGWIPKPYRPLYFGESHRIQSRATSEHEKHLSWRQEAGLFSVLYRALCPCRTSPRLNGNEPRARSSLSTIHPATSASAIPRTVCSSAPTLDSRFLEQAPSSQLSQV